MRTLKGDMDRLHARWIRFVFEFLKACKIFFIIEKLGLEIKEPFKKMYNKTKQ